MKKDLANRLIMEKNLLDVLRALPDLVFGRFFVQDETGAKEPSMLTIRRESFFDDSSQK